MRPGIQKAIKPDLCDDGGNVLFDGTTQTLKRFAESEVVTTFRVIWSACLPRLGNFLRGPLVATKQLWYYKHFLKLVPICYVRYWQIPRVFHLLQFQNYKIRVMKLFAICRLRHLKR